MAVGRYAICDAANLVVNVAAWDGDVSRWTPPPGTVAVLVGPEVGPGGTLDPKTLAYVPPVPVEPEPTREEVLTQTIDKLTAVLVAKGIVTADDVKPDAAAVVVVLP